MSGDLVAGRKVRSALTLKGQAAVALIRLRDGWDDLSLFEQAALAVQLRNLADRYVPRRAGPIA